MVVYTTATSINESFMDTDGSYRVISTAIEADEADCGIIVNTKGEVVGIIPYQNEAISGKIINSYGISELKRLIERLINGKVTPYAGISPQTVCLMEYMSILSRMILRLCMQVYRAEI